MIAAKQMFLQGQSGVKHAKGGVNFRWYCIHLADFAISLCISSPRSSWQLSSKRYACNLPFFIPPRHTNANNRSLLHHPLLPRRPSKFVVLDGDIMERNIPLPGRKNISSRWLIQFQLVGFCSIGTYLWRTNAVPTCSIQDIQPLRLNQSYTVQAGGVCIPKSESSR